MMPEDIHNNHEEKGAGKTHAPGQQDLPSETPKIVQGDVVQGDKMNAGDIKDSAVAFGQGAMAVQGDVHYHYGAQKPETPRQDFEPEMVLVPAGAFLMGSDDWASDEQPLHNVSLPSFAISLFPITNWQFARFVWDTRRHISSKTLQWYGNEPPDDRLNHPVAGVTWSEALAYCSWLEQKTGRSYRLPNEAQWEKAARGIDGRLYPWGNEWEDGRCNTSPTIAKVDAFPVQTVYGCCDMVGNAREWTLTIWGSSRDPKYKYQWQEDGRNDPHDPANPWRVYRGGRRDSPQGYRCSARGGYLPTKPGPSSNRHGFRVVLPQPKART